MRLPNRLGPIGLWLLGFIASLGLAGRVRTSETHAVLSFGTLFSCQGAQHSSRDKQTQCPPCFLEARSGAPLRPGRGIHSRSPLWQRLAADTRQRKTNYSALPATGQSSRIGTVQAKSGLVRAQDLTAIFPGPFPDFGIPRASFGTPRDGSAPRKRNRLELRQQRRLGPGCRGSPP